MHVSPSPLYVCLQLTSQGLRSAGACVYACVCVRMAQGEEVAVEDVGGTDSDDWADSDDDDDGSGGGGSLGDRGMEPEPDHDALDSMF